MKLTLIFISPFFFFTLFLVLVYFRMFSFAKWTMSAWIVWIVIFPAIGFYVGAKQDQDREDNERDHGKQDFTNPSD